MKRLLIAAAALFVLGGIGLVVLARSVLTGANVRAAVEAQLSEALGQPVAIGELGASAWPRVTMDLKDVTIGRPARIRLAAIHLGTGLRPLFSRRIEHADVRVEGAKVTLPLPAFAATNRASPGATSGGASPIEIVSIDEIVLTQVEITGGARTVRGDVELVPHRDGLQIRRVSLSADGATIAMTGTLASLSPLRGGVEVSAESLDIDRLVAFIRDFVATPFSTPAAGAPAAVTPPSGSPIEKLTLGLKVGGVTTGGLTFSGFNASGVVTPTTIEFEALSCGVFGGRYEGALRLGLGAVPQVEWSGAVTGIDAAKLMAFAGSPDTISGSLAGSIRLRGQALQVEQALRSATGRARVDITNGSIAGLQLVRTLVTASSGRGGIVASVSSAAAASREQTGSERFSRLGATLRLEGGVIATDDIAMTSPDVDSHRLGHAARRRPRGGSRRTSAAVGRAVEAGGHRPRALHPGERPRDAPGDGQRPAAAPRRARGPRRRGGARDQEPGDRGSGQGDPARPRQPVQAPALKPVARRRRCRRRWHPMRARAPALASLSIVAAALATPAAAQTPPAAQTIRRMLDRLHANGEFTGSILVARGGSVVYRDAIAATPAEAAAELEQPVGIASVAKGFTAMAVMRLHEQGKLAYDDPVARYVPAMAAAPAITIRHLLTHTSGIPDVGDLGIDQPGLSEADVLEAVKAHAAQFAAPGTSYRNSNTGYLLLAMVIERVSGQGFDPFLRATIFQPLGMFSTRSAQGDRGPGTTKGDGGLVSTVDDLLLWSQALAAGTLVKATTLADALTPPRISSGTTTYGFGWNIEEKAGDTYVWHTGNGDGRRAFIGRRMRDGITIVILTLGASRRTEIADAIVDILHDRPFTAPRLSVAPAVLTAIDAQGVEAGVARYRQLRGGDAAAYDFAEGELNGLGYTLLGRGDVAGAVRILELNTEQFPGSSNAFDSLGEALARAGRRADAARAYTRALELDPHNLNAQTMLQKLR